MFYELVKLRWQKNGQRVGERPHSVDSTVWNWSVKQCELRILVDHSASEISAETSFGLVLRLINFVDQEN